VTDRVDQYGRLLRYIVRVADGQNVNVQLVRVGAAGPYFYERRRGRHAALLERLALRARARNLGLRGVSLLESGSPGGARERARLDELQGTRPG
jgi:endonuclease YncB( thermonuclease family)